MNRGSIFFISFIVLSVLVIATTYSISYVQKQNHIEEGIAKLEEMTGNSVVYRSFPNLEKYDKAFWFQDENKNDYELDIDTLAFEKYRYAGIAEPDFIISDGEMNENIVLIAKSIYPEFFEKEYALSTDVIDADEVIAGHESEQIVYIKQTSGSSGDEIFEFVILDDEIYQIRLYTEE